MDLDQAQTSSSSSDYQLVKDKERKVSRSSQRYGFSPLANMIAYAFLVATQLGKEELDSYEEALSCKDSKT